MDFPTVNSANPNFKIQSQITSSAAVAETTSTAVIATPQDSMNESGWGPNVATGNVAQAEGLKASFPVLSSALDFLQSGDGTALIASIVGAEHQNSELIQDWASDPTRSLNFNLPETQRL
jgi:hypothetical protein